LCDLPDLERLQDARLLGATEDQEALRGPGPNHDHGSVFDRVRAPDPFAEIDEPHEDAA
jgi:hypothetical protein